jgi:hypothetical protein
MDAIRVGIISKIKTDNPDTTGEATKVVEKVAKSMKKNNRSQSFFSHFGQLTENP